MNLQREK